MLRLTGTENNSERLINQYFKMNTIKLIRDKFGIAVLLIEHDMKLVLGICERLVVLNYGQILASGDPQEVINNSKVVEAYLGKEEDE